MAIGVLTTVPSAAYAGQQARYHGDLDLRVGVAASDKVDALVVTAVEWFPELTPAATDPVLGKKKLPADYLTTVSNTRKAFYHPPNTNPTTPAADERAKATTTAAEVPGFAQELTSHAFAKAVRVPVRAAPSVQAELVPNAGHDLAPHRNAPSTTALIDRWASSAVA
jgi:hypothetical protein